MPQHMSQTYDMGCKGLRPYVKKEFGGIKRKQRGTYKTKAINNRIREFLNEFENLYPIGCKINKHELEYWIQRFQLCNDRVSIKQYVKRFLMQGYFSVRNGVFTFLSKQPKQPTLREIMNVRKQIMTLRAVTRRPRRRRAW
jgi:hypothetical protein